MEATTRRTAATLGALGVVCLLATGACARSPSRSDATTTAADWVSASKAEAPRPPETSSNTLSGGWSASGCRIRCRETNGRRMAKTDAARLVSTLEPIVAQMRQCPAGNPPPPLVLRFDSTSTLTSFGVDAGGLGADAGGLGADTCIDAFRQSGAEVTYPGPAVVRCTADCGS